MRIAIEGCCHGELDNIYATIAEAEATEGGLPVELLLICGDFEALRNHSDLNCMAVPDKYKYMADFWQYYSGQKKAPILTLVIGGNHEASNYMWELFHGGWLAPNIYYLGAAGSVLVNGLRISGISGIYKSMDYRKGRFETLPYDRSTIRSIYHTREYDVHRLAQLPLLSAYPSIVLSHDWPNGIERHGDTAGLLRYKPYFRDEVNTNTLGSPPLAGLLRILKPAYWFSAHLHVKFSALFKQDGRPTTIRPRNTGHTNGTDTRSAVSPAATTNPDELQIDDDDEEDHVDGPQSDGPVSVAVDTRADGNPDELVIDDDEEENSIHPRHPPPGLTDHISDGTIDESVSALEKRSALEDIKSQELDAASSIRIADTKTQSSLCNVESDITRFLALSKCLPGQNFLQLMDIASPAATAVSEGPQLTFDPEWLAISRAYHRHLSLNVQQTPLPTDPTICKAMVERELEWVRKHVSNNGAPLVSAFQHFQPTAPHPGQPGGQDKSACAWYTNPQTEAFCQLIGVSNLVNPAPPS